MRKTREVLQQKLTNLATHSRKAIATQSGHLIQIEQPALVIAEIRSLIRSLR